MISFQPSTQEKIGGVLSFLKAVLRRLLTPERAEIGMAMCGLVALITPLLLWVSWSPEMLKGILVMGFASFLLATWFAQYACPETIELDEEVLPNSSEFPASGTSSIATDSDPSHDLPERKAKK